MFQNGLSCQHQSISQEKFPNRCKTDNIFVVYFISKADSLESVLLDDVIGMSLIWRHTKTYLLTMLLAVVVLRIVNVMARIASAVAGSEPISVLYMGKLLKGDVLIEF